MSVSDTAQPSFISVPGAGTPSGEIGRLDHELVAALRLEVELDLRALEDGVAQAGDERVVAGRVRP